MTNRSARSLMMIALAASVPLTFAAQAHADVIIAVRCANDALSPDQAKARLEWARACGVPNHVDSFDTAIPSANNAGNLIEYIETNDFWGKNAFTGTSAGNQVNDAFVRSQFLGGATSQSTVNGYKKWTRSKYLARPLYPTFGTTAYAAAGSQLYPHPQLSNCNLYYDKNGQNPINKATTEFYVNAYCTSSCYTPEQEILFPDGYKPIVEALDELQPRMMTLSSDSTLGAVSLAKNDVYSYTRELRDGKHLIFEIRTASGGLLRVTDRHPVIDASGRIVEARSLAAGDELIRVNGRKDAIVSVTKTQHAGKVYNIRPRARDRVSNILVAQGFLVGSSKFQNEDADYMNRVILGRSIPHDVLP